MDKQYEALPKHRDLQNPTNYIGQSKYENGVFSCEIPAEIVKARGDYSCECLYKLDAIINIAEAMEKSLENPDYDGFSHEQMVPSLGIAIKELASQAKAGYSVMMEEYCVQLPEKESAP